ncbi:MAG TPA: TerC family protein, partial [Rhodopila sp.]|nr:TerC family protein [Rhodopila sp.]
MDWLSDPQAWTGLLTLTAMEIVLGIDNLVFIAVLVARVRPAHQAWTRRVGLGLALVTRIALLGGITWIAELSAPVFTVAGHGFSWRDLVLSLGGLFLVYKGTTEIHARIEGDTHGVATTPARSGL